MSDAFIRAELEDLRRDLKALRKRVRLLEDAQRGELAAVKGAGDALRDALTDGETQ